MAGKRKFNNIISDDDYISKSKNKNITIEYENNDKFQGTIEYNKKQGKGVYTYSNGDVYEGYYINDKKHGAGIYTSHSTGRRYNGMWKNDKMHGHGVMTNKKEKYIGQWINGKLICKNKVF